MRTSTNFSKEAEKIFPITADVKTTQERWNKLMVLIFLVALCSEFSKARPNVIDSSTVNSLEDTYFLCEVVPSESKSSQRGDPRSSCSSGPRQTIGDRSRGSDFGVRGRRRGCGGVRSGGRGGEVIYCHYCNEPGQIKYNCPLLQGKQWQPFRSAQ